MNLPQRHQRPEPRPRAGPQEIYLKRSVLPVGEQALLDLVISLSWKEGHSFAQETWYAEWLGCTPRWVRMMLVSLQKKGYVALTYRHRKGPLVKPLPLALEGPDEGMKIGPKPGPVWRNSPSPSWRKSPSSQGRKSPSRPTSSLTENTSFEQAPLFDRRPKQFNPLRWQKPNDQRRPEVRLRDAIRDGTVLYVRCDGRQRVIQDIRYTPTDVWLFLLREDGPDAEHEKLIVPIRELGSWWFGR